MKWIKASEALPQLDNELDVEMHGEYMQRKYVVRFEEDVVYGFDRAALYTAKEIRGITFTGHWEWLDESINDDSEPLIAELIRLYNKHGEESTRLVLENYKQEKEK